MGGASAARVPNTASISAIHASRLRSTRTSNSRRPRAMASVGGTMLASRAGANAETSATPMPATKASDDGSRGKGHGAWAAGDIEGIHRGRKHAHGSRGKQAAQGQCSQGTCCAKQRSLQQKCTHDRTAACAQRAHDADIGAPAHHGN